MQLARRAFHAHLHALTQVLPVEAQRNLRMRVQLPALVAFVVGEEAEAALVGALQQHDARADPAGRVGGRQVHRIGFGVAAGRGLVQQAAEGIQDLAFEHDSCIVAAPRHHARMTNDASTQNVALAGHLLDHYAGRIARSRRPYILGLSGLQGSGKSTLARVMKARAEARGWPTEVLTLDDFYYARSEREALAREVHPLLRTRGVPGTHEIELLLSVLAALPQHRRNCRSPAAIRQGPRHPRAALALAQG